MFKSKQMNHLSDLSPRAVLALRAHVLCEQTMLVSGDR